MADETQDSIAAKALNDDAKNNYYKTMLRAGFGLAGGVAGILIAVKRKSGFWGGVGWWIVMGAAGSAAGFVIGSVADGKPK